MNHVFLLKIIDKIQNIHIMNIIHVLLEDFKKRKC